MEDVADEYRYCKAILPHHPRFGLLSLTTRSYEATKRVSFGQCHHCENGCCEINQHHFFGHGFGHFLVIIIASEKDGQLHCVALNEYISTIKDL